MILGVCGWPGEECFKMAAARGLAFVEFTANVDSNLQDFYDKVESIKQWSKQYNVAVGSIGRWGSERIQPDGTISPDELAASYRLIEIAGELGCDNFVCGVNYVDALSYYENTTVAISFLSKLIEHGKAHRVKISVYNCDWGNFINNAFAWRLVHGHLKELGIKFDPSHSIYARRDYLKEARDWGDRFYHVHIKGTLVIDGRRFDDPPAGLDQINWGAFLSILYAKKYDRRLSIEPHSKVWRGELGEKGLDYTIGLIKTMLF